MLAAICCAILVVLLLLLCYQLCGFLSDFLTGLWTAPHDFCERADITGMMVYIGRPEAGEGRRSYILMIQGDQVLFRRLVIIKGLSSALLLYDCATGGHSQRIIIADAEREDGADYDISNAPVKVEEVFPRQLEVMLDVERGRMTWRKNKLYADLYKDNLASASS